MFATLQDFGPSMSATEKVERVCNDTRIDSCSSVTYS